MRIKITFFAFLPFLLLACNNKKNINDQFSSLRSNNNILLTLDECHSKFRLYNDSVFSRESLLPYTGSIEILGTVRYTDENGVFMEKQSTIALFSIKNGAFNGKQIYTVVYEEGISSGSLSSNNVFIKSEIPKNWDMIKGVDYKEANKNEPHNYMITKFGYPFYYQINNLKKLSPVEIEIYWPNGNLLLKSNYAFYNINYFLANEAGFDYKKLLYPEPQLTFKIFHYNGKVAYAGKLNANGTISSSGEYFNLYGSKTESDSSHFQAPLGAIGHETNFNIVFNNDLTIKDEAFKSYRQYFISDNPHLYKNKFITKDGTVHYPDAHEAIMANGSVMDTAVKMPAVTINNTIKKHENTKDNSVNNPSNNIQKCFYSDGLKYRTVINITFLSPIKVKGFVEDYDGDKMSDKVEFTGTKNRNRLNVQFNGSKPIVGANSEWTDEPWIINKINGNDVLNINFLAKNYDTNKWENSNYEFMPCE